MDFKQRHNGSGDQSNTFLRVSELIAQHGGAIHPESWQPPMECTPEDIDDLWHLVAADPKHWNRSISVLREFENRSFSENKIILPLEELQYTINNFWEKTDLLQNLLEKFRRYEIIRDESRRDFLHYSYRTPLLRYCTEKAGNVLEVKTLLEARAMGDFFQDGLMSVHIDWDGVIYDPEDRIPETRNEIDLVLTRQDASLFISCKNGFVGDEELYKLHTVATRFGGSSARKMLIATDLDQKSEIADKALRQRAEDMGICLVDEAARLDRNGWRETFQSAFR